MDHKLAPKWASPGVRDPISKFWDPLNISQTEKATIFKFGMHIGHGQFLPPDHKLARNWPTVSRGGAYCGGHLAAQLVLASCKPGFQPGLQPGFRQVRAGLRHAFDMLSTFFVENLVANLLHQSRRAVVTRF